jgi:RNA polymerase sigma-70 factor, ECF subfamily
MALDPDAVAAELPSLTRYAVYLTRDPADAEDLVQDTVERALARGDSFRGESSLSTWLHRVMHRRFLDTVRQRAPEPTPDDELLARVEAAWRDDSYTVDPEMVLARAEVRDGLRDALVHVPVILRSAVVLHDMQGLTSAEVAAVHGIGVPAAKQRLRRGRALLVSLLADDADRRQALKGVPMRCWQARSLVGDYLDDELGPRERSMLEGHLASCPTCPGLYASIVGVSAALGRLRDPDSVVPPDLAARLRGAGRSGTTGGAWPAG